MRAAFAALASHWRAKPLQAAAVVVGLMLATALWSGIQALNGEARSSYAEAAAILDGDRLDRLEPIAEGRLTLEIYVALRRAGWAVSPVIEGRVTVGGRSARLIGVDPLTLPNGRLTGAFDGGPGIGAFSAPPWSMLAAPETIEDLGLRVGERASSDRGPLPETAVARALAPGVLVVDIGAAEALLGRTSLDALLIDPEAPRPDTGWAEVAGEALRLVEADDESDLERLTKSFHLNLTAFGVLSFCVGLFITHAAVGLAFEQRLGTLRTLRACGMSARSLTVVLLGELVLVALFAGALGLIAGYGIAAALLPDVAATLAGLYGAEVPGALTLRPEWWLAGLCMSLGGALVAAGHTLALAWGMPVLASARPEAWHGAQQRSLRLQAGFGFLALVLAGLAIVLGGGLTAGFVSMASLMIGATLLLPPVLAGALSAAQRVARGPVVEWVIADARQQISGLGLALMALLLALSTNIGVGTMVESFRATFTTWLDQRLFADVYVDPAPEQTARFRDWAEDRDDVAETLETVRTQAILGGVSVAVVGRPAGSSYRTEWPFLAAKDDAWDRIAAGEGAIVSEQLARRLGLALGDPLDLPAPEGAWTLETVAIYADYGNPKGEVGVDRERLTGRWPGTASDGFGLRLAPGASSDAVMRDVEAAFGAGPDALIDNAALKVFSHRVFERTFAVTAMLNVLTLAIAGAALFASLATLADRRLAQVAPLWAMGLTRRRLAVLDLAKTAALATLTAVLAIPLGLAVAWLLVAVVNVEAFGWRLPLHIFPGQWAALMALTLGVALLAGALPALRLARMAPARLVKIFAEER
ncbi:MAG: FtsX-like permease family protein [Pseudomonadota bacterium]